MDAKLIPAYKEQLRLLEQIIQNAPEGSQLRTRAFTALIHLQHALPHIVWVILKLNPDAELS